MSATAETSVDREARANFSAVIRQEMEWQSVRPPAVARLSGIPLSTFRRRLSGETPWLVTELVELADVLDVGIVQLFRRAEDAQQR